MQLFFTVKTERNKEYALACENSRILYGNATMHAFVKNMQLFDFNKEIL